MALDLKGCCFLCLTEGQDPSSLSTCSESNSFVEKDNDNVKSFQALLCYLTGYQRRNDDQEEEVNGDLNNVMEIIKLLNMMNKLPSLCERCLGSLTELKRLHAQLLEIQSAIQLQTVKIRNYVSDTIRAEGEGDNGTCVNRRDRFLEFLKKSAASNSSSECILKLHDLIISRGNMPVIFPSNLPSGDALGSFTEHDNNTISQTQTLDIDFEVTQSTKNDQLGVLTTVIEEEHSESRNAGSYISVEEVVMEEEEIMAVPIQIEDGNNMEILKTSNMEELSSSKQHANNPKDNSGLNIGGVPVDPSANYVMITSNITDPNTGVISMQPVLINVAQLQAMQQSASIPSVPVNSTYQQEAIIPSIQPSTSSQTSKYKRTRNDPVGSYSTPTEQLYYKEDLQPCDVCNARIPRGSEVASHLATHVGSDYVFYCSECQLGFISPFRLQKYHRSKPIRCRLDTSPDGPMFSCSQCNFCTDTMKPFRRHLEEHEIMTEVDQKNFRCPLCPLRFSLKMSVHVHLEEKHIFTKPSGRQKCDVCGSFFDFGEIEAHLWSHGISEILRCKLCMCIFSSVDTIMEHQSVVKRRGLHDACCHVCESRFLRAKDLHLHYFEEHALGKKYMCVSCPKEFFSLHTFEAHQKKCGQLDPSEEVASTSSSKKNKATLQQQRPQKKECPECGKLMSTLDTLLRHRIKEHGHPPVKCSRLDCNEQFHSETERKAHVASVHQGFTLFKKPYSCAECGETFTKKEKLKSHHFVKHSDAKPFNCEICGTAYRNKSTLQDHINLKHFGMKKEKNKVCDICNRAFSDSQVLKHHKLIHTKERPFSCKTCGQRFRQRTAMRTHERGHAQLGEAFKPKGEMERNDGVNSAITS